MSQFSPQPNAYDTKWNAQDYLRQYFSTPYVPDDSQAVLRFLTEQLSSRPGEYETAIDFGCGPALYTAIAVVPYVRELHLSDYLPANLQEVVRWLGNEPNAHDWDVYLRWITELQLGITPSAEHITDRIAELRRKVSRLHQSDIRQPNPLGEPQTFDLVVSCFCIESVSTDRGEWEQLLGNLSNLVKDGGSLMLASVRRCSSYEILGRLFPAAQVDEDDFTRILPQLGFEPSCMVIRTVPITEWVAEGFDSICLVAAQKTRDA